ncbi:MAG: RNA degradosome polyphosphate kinase [Lentisphaerae bacterium RIFOXYA12_FULL_48_11]|nr:MAG: RNA degradosome polyphosphate kinase [Lentisphaerae bacterium RIFOXYA12_FULL_48_11]
MSKTTNLINRELSWLEFNQRVLSEASDASVPLLERLNFLCITASNLDEFFMVRVGGLELLISDGVEKVDNSGMTPREQLDKVLLRSREMVKAQYACFTAGIEPELASAGIRLVSPEAYSEQERNYLEKLFLEEIYPVASPQAVKSVEEFPLVPNLRLNLAVRLEGNDDGKKPLYAVIPLGSSLRRLVRLPADKGCTFTTVENVVRSFIGCYFPGKKVMEISAFRITRNADFNFNDEVSSDFMADMESLVSRRREERCIRLEVEAAASKMLTDFLRKALQVRQESIFELQGPVGLVDFREMLSVDGFNALRYKRWEPQQPADIDSTASMFIEIAKRDILLCHPYDNYEPVVKFIQEAADDPDVLSIKQTLYRTSPSSPIVQALDRAARKGKYVTALVELRARFDEERNISWAKSLEKSGVQVIYGLKGLKTHSKICLVVRREQRGIVRYVHFGTGNYNERTARLYTDISFMTCDDSLGSDASLFFNTITGYSEPQKFLKLHASPIGMKEKLIELIENEAGRSKDGQKAGIMAKMNSLVDPDVIEALYSASKAGVQVKLNVRGICCLRPGMAKLSENVSVVSIVDRFLEHSRIFYFLDGGVEKMFISSADWMPRNLVKRVELMVPVENKACKAKLKMVLESCFKDMAKSSRLKADGAYERLADPKAKGDGFRCQEFLYRSTCQKAEDEAKVQQTVFTPHKSPDLEKK